MEVFLTRHAHRNTTDRSLDNGLSERGWQQAHNLARQIEDALITRKLLKAAGVSDAPADLKGKVRLVSSPKLRCLETLDPISRRLGLGIEIDSRLDEQRDAEKSSDFLKRIQEFVAAITRPKGEYGTLNSIVLCSHGDWIPEFTSVHTGRRISLEKGSMVCLSDSA